MPNGCAFVHVEIKTNLFQKKGKEKEKKKREKRERIILIRA